MVEKRAKKFNGRKKKRFFTIDVFPKGIKVQRFQVLRLFWDLKKSLGISNFLDKVFDIVDIVDIVDTVDIIESVHTVVMVDIVDIVDVVDICEAIWVTSYKSLWIPRLSNLKNVN